MKRNERAFADYLYENRVLPTETFSARVDETLAEIQLDIPRNAANEPARRQRRVARHTARWLVPVAAAVCLLVVLFSVPSVAEAVRGWIYDIFRADRYVYVPESERTHDPDFDSVITTEGNLEQTNELRLLSDTKDYERVDAARKEAGFPAYDPAEWTWLTELRPTISELYYDGVDFFAMTFFPCDPKPFMSGYISGALSDDRLDVLSLGDASLENLDTGETTVLYPDGSGLVPQPDYRNEDGSANVAAIEADGGVWLYTSYTSPDYGTALPAGRYRVKVTHWILDGNVEDMGARGIVAELFQTFVLDTRAALAAIEKEALPSVTLSGTYPVTVTRRTETATTFSIEQVDFTGLVVTPTVERRATGVRVRLAYSLPTGWSEETKDNVLQTVMYGLRYELLLDGASAGLTQQEYDPDGYWIDIPLTASERQASESLVLRPVVECMTEMTVDGTKHALAEGYTLPHNTGFDSPVTNIIPIPGAEIVLPLS